MVTARERALEILAGKEASGSGFMAAAARALALGLGCRWAGIGELAPDGQSVNVLSFWDGEKVVSPFSYELHDSPCNEVYRSTPTEPYRFFPKNVTELYSGPPILKQLGACSYRGEAIFDSDGRHRAHTFAIDDKPVAEDAMDLAFFRLVSQRAGAEYNRLVIERELQRAKEEAEQASRAKTEFLANMNHELRTPLNAMMGLSEIIMGQRLGAVGHPKYLEYVLDIHRSAGELLGMISNILDFSLIESGKMVLQEEAVDVAKVLAGCVSHLEERVQAGDVTVTCDVADNVPQLWADPGKLEQIVDNLMSNAVKFTLPGGRVTVSAELAGDDGVEIRVVDFGVGMRNEDIVRALAPFRQGSAMTREAGEGTGLGLPLAKSLSHLMDGELIVQSTPGVGTTVTLHLPKARLCRGNSETLSRAAG